MTSKNFRSEDEKWAAVQHRDPSAEGTFLYAVKTTGIFCRPACASRLPQRDNVLFFASVAEARSAGFRPCKRCRPEQPVSADAQPELIARVCRKFESNPEVPSLERLASSAGMSPFQFHKLFKSIVGVTPRAYFAGRRANRMEEELKRSPKITDALYQAGFNSSGRFYAATDQRLGMTPSEFRRGGAGKSMRFAMGECSLGSILVAATERGVCAILLGDDPEALVRDFQDRFPKANILGSEKEFEQWVATVIGFVEAPQDRLSVPIDMRGTAFQQRVWQALREIPCGSTASYSEIAERIGAPKSSRAVARACASNSLAVAIPCHRVVRQDGSLSGYRWGIDRKLLLLNREASLLGKIEPISDPAAR